MLNRLDQKFGVTEKGGFIWLWVCSAKEFTSAGAVNFELLTTQMTTTKTVFLLIPNIKNPM